MLLFRRRAGLGRRGLLGLVWLFVAVQSGLAAPARSGIVSLAPNLTELVYALGLGSQLVARSSACDYPPAAQALPVAGDFGRPNLEELARRRPALVLVTDVENPAVLPAIRASGTPCLQLSCEGWTNLMAAAAAIGEATHEPDRARAWQATMNQRREHLQQQVASWLRERRRPVLYVEIWKDPLTTPGAGSFLDDLVDLAGGRNLAHALTPMYTHVNPEWVVEQQPDGLVLLYMTPVAGEALAEVRARTGWSRLVALQRGHVCTSIPPDLLLRSGPRCLDGAELLATWLQARF